MLIVQPWKTKINTNKDDDLNHRIKKTTSTSRLEIACSINWLKTLAVNCILKWNLTLNFSITIPNLNLCPDIKIQVICTQCSGIKVIESFGSVTLNCFYIFSFIFPKTIILSR